MVQVFCDVAGVDEMLVAHDITREQRDKLITTMKAFPMTIVDTRGFKEAIVTQGGVSVKEVNPSTMECKTIKGLYLAGEVLGFGCGNRWI